MPGTTIRCESCRLEQWSTYGAICEREGCGHVLGQPRPERRRVDPPVDVDLPHYPTWPPLGRRS